MSLERDGDDLEIHLAPAGAEPVGPAEVYLVRFLPSAEVAIGGGENAGRDVTYTNIVTDWDTVGHWDGAAPVDLRAEASATTRSRSSCRRRHMGPVLTAAELR